MSQNKIRDFFTFCLGIVLIGVLVQAAGVLKGDQLVFPGVGEILRIFFRLLAAPKTYVLIWTTLKHLLASMAVSTVIGIGLGVAMGMLPFVRNLMRPLMIMLRSLPMIILIVITMVVASYDVVPVLASSIILIPMIAEAACEGCLRIDKELIDVYRMNSSFNGRVLLQVYLPLMAGYLKQAYVNAVGMGVKLAVSTEYLVTSSQAAPSLGKAVYSHFTQIEYGEIYAYALIMILLALIVSEGPMLIGKAAAAMKREEK